MSLLPCMNAIRQKPNGHDGRGCAESVPNSTRYSVFRGLGAIVEPRLKDLRLYRTGASQADAARDKERVMPHARRICLGPAGNVDGLMSLKRVTPVTAAVDRLGRTLSDGPTLVDLVLTS